MDKTLIFDLHSVVYDDGEAIDSVVLKTSNLEIDDSKITKDMFNVHATGTTVYSSQLEKEFFGPNSQSGLQHCGLYDEERKVESVEEKNGNIILHLVTDEETKGKNTLDFTANFTTLKGCSSLLNIKYTDYSLVIAPVVADLCTTSVALSAPPNSYQNNSQS